MHTYDIINETIIHAPTEHVWHELIAELNGATTWWTPHNTFQPGTTSPEHIGGTTHITVHPKGNTKGGPKIRFTATTTHTTPHRHLATDYTHGAFRGHATYTLTPLHHNTQTRLTMHFTATPHGWLTLLAKLTNIGTQHSTATQNAFTHLNTHLTTTPRSTR
ncbi:SRPBCC family protein [Kitasatospora sp. NPDC087861]|uniref:SRPBCC family protein n=1 Tax=Kitasatospora sp. NPDC087861 TaxID=3364070 RepID=UPI003824C8E1